MAKKIVKTLISPVASILGVFGGKKSAPAAEAGPKVMPLADDQMVTNARKKSIAAQMKRGGRSSTILSDPGSTLGS